MTFPRRRLGDVASIQKDVVRAASIEDGTIYVGLEHITSEGRLVGVEPVAAGDLASSKFRFDSRHLLFGKLRPYLAKIARPEFAGICSTDILPILPGPSLDRNFLFYCLRQPKMVAVASSRTTGANLPRLSPRALAEFDVPVPPIAEQRRIANVLERADELRAKRRGAADRLKSLRQSIFLDMFSELPESAVRLLGDVAQFFGGTTLPTGENFIGQSDGYLLLKVSDMNSDGNETAIVRSTLWSGASGPAASTCPAGAVIIPKRGGAIGTNKKRLLTRPAVLDPNLMGVVPRPEFLSSAYLLHWFTRFDLASITSGSSVPQLNKRDLAPLAIPVPPREMQSEFATRLDGVDAFKSGVRQSVDAMEDLFNSLQQRAFTGAL